VLLKVYQIELARYLINVVLQKTLTLCKKGSLVYFRCKIKAWVNNHAIKLYKKIRSLDFQQEKHFHF